MCSTAADFPVPSPSIPSSVLAMTSQRVLSNHTLSHEPSLHITWLLILFPSLACCASLFGGSIPQMCLDYPSPLRIGLNLAVSIKLSLTTLVSSTLPHTEL